MEIISCILVEDFHHHFHYPLKVTVNLKEVAMIGEYDHHLTHQIIIVVVIIITVIVGSTVIYSALE